jgi:DNA-binding protein WhiA
MSFSSEVKTELASVVPIPKHCKIAEIAGYILYSQKKSVDKCDMSVLKSLTDDLGNENDFVKMCRLEENNGLLFLKDMKIIERSCCKRSFLRGAFLGAGSVADPKDEYHLEISARTRSGIELLNLASAAFDVAGKVAQRGSGFRLYFKDADKISDLLNIMEAHVSLMNFENERILKEVKNKVNRRVNCETSNLKKTVVASEYACECIRYLDEANVLKNLPETLQSIAELRVTYPEKSLSELGEMTEPRLGRSGVNHRLEKIIAIARDLKGKEEQDDQKSNHHSEDI